METLRGIKIRTILLDNNNWLNFYNKFKHLIRLSIVINVCKLLACGTAFLGFHHYTCQTCGNSKKVFHTCKSRFCSPCGKKSTEEWIAKNLALLPQTPWQHITFTLPAELREFFWLNRHLLNHIAKIPAAIITKYAKAKKLIPGIFMAIHTFGRDLKTNPHFHLSTTSGGLVLDYSRWVSNFYIHHQTLKDRWKQQVIQTIRDLYNDGKLILPPSLNHITSYASFNSWLNFLYHKSWVVHLQKKCSDHHKNIKYLGRYLKRPPMAETRIVKYDGSFVSYLFMDHHDKQRTMVTLDIEEFIKRLIRHIPDSNFRMIRYYNWLANRKRATLMPKVFLLLNLTFQANNSVTYHSLFFAAFGHNPLQCQNCKSFMILDAINYPPKSNITSHHQELATTKA